jgi:hypothetical protein
MRIGISGWKNLDPGYVIKFGSGMATLLKIFRLCRHGIAELMNWMMGGLNMEGQYAQGTHT